MRNQARIFLAAVMYYTRIPCPAWADHSDWHREKSAVYLPLIGWIAGGSSAVVFWMASQLFPVSLSLVFAIAASVLVTGAIHEDGFADACDGFGGGWTREQVLDIMKDSRIGTFGVVGIVFILAFKYLILIQFPTAVVPVLFIAGHSLSRIAPVSLMQYMDYARNKNEGKVAALKLDTAELGIAFTWGILPLTLFGQWIYAVLIVPVLLTAFLMGLYFRKKIHGYTGDCLGAAQQVSEVVFYLSVYVLQWTFT